MHQLRIAVLRGGPSREYDISLKTGANILKTLSPEKFKIEDIFVSKDGQWHRHGMATSPNDALRGIDVLINAMHGDFGEDGRVQRIVKDSGVAYTGAEAFGASMSLNKDTAKKAYKNKNLKTPEHLVFKGTEEDVKKIALQIFREFPQPSIIKPVYGGSSFDIYYCDTYEKVFNAINILSLKNEPFIVEEYIKGKEASAAVVEDFRGNDLYALPPVEIRNKSPYFSYEDKYTVGGTHKMSPGSFSPDEREMLRELAREAHDALHLRHYSQSDFIVTPRAIYILETNALPGLTETSILPHALDAAGSNLSEFLEHIINLAKEK